MALPTVPPVAGDVVLGVQGGVIKFFLVDELLGGSGGGENGASAYELAGGDATWGSVAAWLESLQGENGASAYELAYAANPTIGTEAEWIDSIQGVPGDTGASAYELAGGDATWGSVAAWLESLQGENGASAYELAYAASPTIGTQEQWLESLKGEPGTPGASAYELAGGDATWGSVAAWLESLQGQDSTVPGPSAYEVAGGDAVWGSEAAWLAQLVGPSGEDSEVPGPPGSSAYEVAGGDAVWGNVDAWLLSLKGNTIHSGIGAPAVGLGVNGDYYIDYEVVEIYGPKTAAGWGPATSLIGPPGGGGSTEEVLGPELVPAFTDAGWDTTGSIPPTIDADGIHFNNASGLSSARYVTDVIVPNATYEVTFTIENYVSGNAQVGLYSEDGTLGNTSNATSGNGTYVERIITNGNAGLANQIRMRCTGTSTFDIPAFSVKEILVEGGVDVDTSVFVQAGIEAVERTPQDKMREWVSIKDFHDPAVDGTDYSPALTKAMNASRFVFFPPGIYRFVTRVVFLDNVTLAGPDFKTGLGAAAVTLNIVNNDGWLLNPNSATVDDRRSLSVQNMKIVGPGAGVGIQGAGGHNFTNVTIINFDKGIENPSAFLSQYIRCTFDDCTLKGIDLADTNAVRIEDCWFSATCQTAFDNTSLPAIAPGNNSGTPMIVNGNNVNQGNAGGTNRVGVKLRGNFTFIGNYYEDYSTAPSNNVFLEVTVNRFDNGAFSIRHNEMNGQGQATSAIRLVGSHTNMVCKANGVITQNRMIGFSDPIHCGTAELPNNNFISHLRVFENNENTVTNLNPRGIYKPMVDMGFTSTVSVGGADVVLPMASITYFDNCDGVVSAGNVGRPRKDGAYDVTADVQLSAATNVWITHGGAEIARINGATGSVSLGAIVECLDGDSIVVHAGNGGNATRGRLRFKWEGNGMQ